MNQEYIEEIIDSYGDDAPQALMQIFVDELRSFVAIAVGLMTNDLGGEAIASCWHSKLDDIITEEYEEE